MNFTATDQQDPIDMFFSWIIYVVIGELQELCKKWLHLQKVCHTQTLWQTYKTEPTYLLRWQKF